MGKNGEKMGEIKPKTCEGRELSKNQLDRVGRDWLTIGSSRTVVRDDLVPQEEVSVGDAESRHQVIACVEIGLC